MATLISKDGLVAQIAMLQERLRHVETAAQQAHRLHAALIDAAAVLQRPNAGNRGAESWSVLTMACR